jgi:CHAT domain-containing protein
LLEATGDISGLADVLDNSAEAYLTLGRPDESFQRYFRALALHEAREDGAGKARSLHGLGVTYLSTGDPERALGFLRQALPLREAHRDHSGLVSTLRTIAAAEIRRDNPDQARAVLERAVTASHTPLDQARSLIALSELELRMQNPRRARELVERVLSLDVPRNHPLLDRARLHRGKAWLALGNTERAMSDLERARKAFTQTHQLVLESEALLALASVAETRGSVADSLGLVEQAISRIERVRERAINPDMRARYLASRAEAFELRTGLLMRLAESASTADARARRVVQALLSVDDVRVRTLRDAKRGEARDTSSQSAPPRPDIDTLLDRLAIKHAQVARLHEQTTVDAEYVRAQEQHLRLMQAELDLLQGKDLQSGLSLDANGLKSLQARLPPSVSVVVYALTARRGWAWIVRHESVDVVRVPARGELEQLAQAYYRRESNFTTSGPISRRSGLELSRAVIEPVLPHIAGDRILLAPDGPLHYVPMASLPLPGDNARNLTYLVEKFEISEFGSLAQLADTDQARSVRSARWNRELLLVADPVYSSADARVTKSAAKPSTLPARDAAVMISHPLQALPGTAVEAQAILALFPNAESLPLYGFDATRDRLLGEVARGARVIHIATHAYADIGDPRLSYVALSSVDREGGAINGILLAGEIMSSSINADLVTLSGCETHIGEPLFGEGLRGLSQAWIQAGARTVVGSLWKVSDDATQVLMRNFYSQLDRGRVRPSRALRAAQLAVLKDDRYSRPYHWASFVPMTTSMD